MQLTTLLYTIIKNVFRSRVTALLTSVNLILKSDDPRHFVPTQLWNLGGLKGKYFVQWLADKRKVMIDEFAGNVL